MKAVISNRIYMQVDYDLYRKLSRELTYEVPTNVPGRPMVIKNLHLINNNLPKGMKLISIPSGRIDLIPPSYDIEDKRSVVPADIPISDLIELRESQKEFVGKVHDIGILNAKPGWGKTFAAIAAAAELGQKTLVVVHTVALRNQWEKEIVKITGEKPGVIGSGKYNIEPNIVVANTQSLTKHIKSVKKLFGTLILDEMHHVSSPTFTKIIDSSFARYKIGLTGTLRRKDGKHVVFQDYFGHNKYVPQQENTMTPMVHVYSPPFRIPEGNMWADRVNRLCEDPEYQGYIIALADKYVQEGHKVLIVGNRVQFLKFCEALSPNRSVCVTGIDDREAALKKIKNGEADELWGSISIFAEGISVNQLSALILACPINNDVLLEQVTARINRMFPGKLEPIVADTKFCDWTGINQFKNRMEFYRQSGYKVKFMESNP